MMTHLSEYLKYYETLEKPGYAVLVTGPWGVGKTWQVKDAIPQEKLWYVSLYGLSSVQEVHTAILATMLTSQQNVQSLIKSFTGTVKDIGGVYSLANIIPDMLGYVMRGKIEPNDSILVFDDLERSKIDPDDLLGVINQYVEHHDCRVVVIAHDIKLKKKLAKKKEKIFGQQIRAQPETESAMECFFKEVKNSAAKKFIRDNKPGILSVFQESEQQSLRILRHVILDLERLYKVTDPKFRNCGEGMSTVVKLFTAFDIEVRSGQLTAETIQYRSDTSYHRMKNQQADKDEANQHPFVTAYERYSSCNLRDSVLDDSVLINFLINGHYQRKSLSVSLSNSPHFTDPAKLRPWQVVINFNRLPEDIVQAGIYRLQEEFEDRSVTDPCEMLHIFTLRMLLIEKGEISGTIKKATYEAIEYINDLLDKGCLPPHGPDWDLEMDSYGGFAYWVVNDTKPHFECIKKHLKDSQLKAFWQSIKARIDEFLKQIRTDGDQFMSDFGDVAGSSRRYASVPVLKLIPEDKFAKAWVEGDPANAEKVSATLRQRYRDGGLEEEIPWLQKVVEKVDAMADAQKGLSAYRIKRLVHYRLRERINSQTDA